VSQRNERGVEGLRPLDDSLKPGLAAIELAQVFAKNNEGWS
jgi:hypothetical protein